MPARTRKPTPARKPRTRQVPAKRTVDAEFLALLRRKCIRAASVGALTAAGEAVPGLGRVLGLVFGELLDAKLLAGLQRELVDETFALYGLELPEPLKHTLVNKIQIVGVGASAGGDAMMRAALKNTLGRVGGMIAARTLPLAAIATSAASNAAVTYAIGKRAQAVARLKHAPVAGLPDALRAFSGVDERRIYAWSVDAVKDALGFTGKLLGRIAKAPSALRKTAKRRGSG